MVRVQSPQLLQQLMLTSPDEIDDLKGILGATDHAQMGFRGCRVKRLKLTGSAQNPIPNARPGRLDPQTGVQVGSAEVKIHRDNRMPFASERKREICRNKALPHATLATAYSPYLGAFDGVKIFKIAR